jgi:hypothetical protein
MTKHWYRITNNISGHSLGDFDAESAAHALDTMARNAGYTSFADSCEQCGVSEEKQRAEFLVERLP